MTSIFHNNVDADHPATYLAVRKCYMYHNIMIHKLTDYRFRLTGVSYMLLRNNTHE